MNLLRPPATEDLDEISSVVSPYLDALRDKRIFISGATGIIGKWLLAALLHADDKHSLGIRIGALSRDPERFTASAPTLANDERIQFFKGDIRNVAVAPHTRFEYFIHAATDVVAPTSAMDVLDTCVSGTRHALELARCFGVQRFLLLSSGAVYGKTPPDHGPISEDFVGHLGFLSPDSAYANGKRCSELLCAIEHATGSMEIPTARCFAMVGPYLPLDKHFAIGNFISSVLTGMPIDIKGDGSPVRSYLYMTDVIIQLLTILLKGRSCVAYNVGSEERISIADLAHRVTAVLSSSVPIRLANRSIHGVHANNYIPSTTRVREELGISRVVDLNEAIIRTANWNRTDLARPQ